MPKMKTKSGAAKRFKVRGSGSVKRSQAFKRHILTKKTTKNKRQLRGATGVDSANIGHVKSGRYDLVEIDLKNIIAMTKPVVHKIIVETGSLTADEIARVCQIAVHAGAEFVKACTGYGPRGATTEDVHLMRQAVGSLCRIKASGGIKDLASVSALVEAGAERIGTSSGASIMQEYLNTK